MGTSTAWVNQKASSHALTYGVTRGRGADLPRAINCRLNWPRPTLRV